MWSCRARPGAGGAAAGRLRGAGHGAGLRVGGLDRGRDAGRAGQGRAQRLGDQSHAGAEAAEPAHRGVAAGVLNSSAQIGTALGLAVLIPAASSLRAGFVGTAVAAGAGLAAALLLPGRSRPVGEPARGRTESMLARW